MNDVSDGVIDDGRLRVTVARELGGKLAELTDAASGRQWLARHPRLPWRALGAHELAAADAFVRLGDLGGWDECCPTIAASRYPWPPFADRHLPDHGECWSRPAAERRHASGVEHVWRGSSLPFQLVRRLSLGPDGPRLALDYRLAARGAHRIAVLWSAHPLFAIEPGMRLELPDGLPMTVASAGSPLGPKGARFGWPRCGALDLREVTPGAGWATKLFSDVCPSGSVALVEPGGRWLRLAWSSAARLPLRLGLWLNYGGWSGDSGPPLQNLGLEPSLGMPDALAEAVSSGTAYILEPGVESRWTLEVGFGEGRSS